MCSPLTEMELSDLASDDPRRTHPSALSAELFRLGDAETDPYIKRVLWLTGAKFARLSIKADDLARSLSQQHADNRLRLEELGDVSAKYLDSVDWLDTGFGGLAGVVLGRRQREIARELGNHLMPTKAAINAAEPELVPIALKKSKVLATTGARITDDEARKLIEEERKPK